MEEKEKSRRGGDEYHADPDEAIDGARDAGRACFVDVAGVHERELASKQMQHKEAMLKGERQQHQTQ
jgi:hypothetical protein